MARKTEFEKLTEALLDAPWWMSLVAGGVAYIVLAKIFPAILGRSPLFSALIQLLQGIAPFAFLFFCFLGLLAFLKGKKKSQFVNRWDAGEPIKRPTQKPTEDFKFSSTVKDSFDDWTFAAPEETKPTEWSLAVLTCLEWKRFETVCAEYLRLIGHNANETRIGADGGVDIIVHKEGQEKPVAIVQCKAWNTYKVGVKPVRELFGLMAAERITNGIFITSGEFTSEAKDFAQGKRLKLIDGVKLLNAIQQLSVEKQAQLLAVALGGDYTTPTCPKCGIKMILRTGQKGRSSGNKFWGCANYPRCRSTLVYSDK